MSIKREGPEPQYTEAYPAYLTTKICPGCNKPYKRKTFRSGRAETEATFLKRTYCGQKCARDNARKFRI